MNFRYPQSSILHSRSGFTLVELVVVVAITIMLVGVAVLGFGRVSRVTTALTVDGAKIAEIILKAKAQAISTYNIPPIPCGYGLRITPAIGEFDLILYDVPADDPQCTDIKTRPLDVGKITTFRGSSGAEERFSLIRGVKFGGGASPLSYLLFVPPDPKTYVFTDPLGGVPLTSGKGYVYLTSEDLTQTFTIAVSVVGQLTFPP